MGPEGLSYAKTHEWVRIDGDTAVIGISDHAQDELGDIALVQLPEVGRVLQVDEPFGEIESIKAVSELYSPVSGEVVAVNESLEAAPEQVNNSPYEHGWLVRLKIKNLADVDALLTAAQYEKYVEEL